ncbi:MAG TPA: alpha-galactosidase, partial [Candidatus Sumerlaeota bacterium]|nr:alpha-galactosidase [Candidatus Sumerlaeota bacterium]
QVDCMLHVNPRLEQKGFAEFFNPSSTPVTTRLRLPLYYTGLTGKVKIREQEGTAKVVTLSRQYEIEVPIELAPGASTWFVIESGD